MYSEHQNHTKYAVWPRGMKSDIKKEENLENSET
jgi:hypothetical protein